MYVTIALNGTDTNPYERIGFKSNPFPAIPKAEYDSNGTNNLIRDLEANPIKDKADLRSRLYRCSEEFIEGCLERFKPGYMVRFTIEFPER